MQIIAKIASKSRHIKYQDVKLWLLIITTGLAAIHSMLIWRLTDDIDRLSITILIWGVILFILWERRKQLNLNSGFVSSFIGFIIIGFVISKGLTILPFDQPFLRILPLGAFCGMVLIGSGFKGITQYWREFVLTLLIVIPDGVLEDLFEKLPAISLFTAKYATWLLWYLGFEVSRQGVNIIMPTGAVEVYPGCSGLTAMILILKLIIIYLIVFPANLFKTILLPILGVSIAFFINGFRVALMAVLVAYSKPSWFDYWHTGGGSQIFSVISIAIFALFCNLLIRPYETNKQPLNR